MLLRRILTGSAIALSLAALGGFLFLRSIGLFSSDPVFQTQNGAIDGYDTVAYFTQSEAVRGAPDITHDFGGATWHFSSDEHRKLFAASPEQYLPRYGGYCAYAISQNYTAHSDPESWNIEDGKLYLNFDPKVADQWKAERSKLIPAANQNWPDVLGTP